MLSITRCMLQKVEKQQKALISRISNSFCHIPKAIRALISFALVLFIGTLDYWTGYQMSFALFYLVPVGFAAWFIGRDSGIGISLASAVVWQISNKLAGEALSSPLIYLWNTGTRLVVFSIFAILLHKLQVALEHERNLARTDSLTGAMNRRAFYEAFAKELLRVQRCEQPLTLAYIDVDDFKAMNDLFGHSTGDTVLRSVAATLQGGTRGIDVVARLGGDEFAILFPNTDSMGAKKALTRIRDHLQQAMGRADWPVTFSIGAVTCLGPPPTTIEDVLQEVDRVMYRIKQTGKDALQVDTYTC
jgi:diguanylate cyclase (GGDEF)-like protein